MTAMSIFPILFSCATAIANWLSWLQLGLMAIAAVWAMLPRTKDERFDDDDRAAYRS